MQALLSGNLVYLFDKIQIVKKYYDDGSRNVVKLFQNCSQDFEDCETRCYDVLYRLIEFFSSDGLYFEDENGDPVEDGDVYGEQWFLYTTEMREYYQLLEKLRHSGVLSQEVYEEKKAEMREYANQFILYAQDYGVGYRLFDSISDKGSPRIEIELFFEYYYDIFSLACGVIALLDIYENKLRELKEAYCETKSILEAA